MGPLGLVRLWRMLRPGGRPDVEAIERLGLLAVKIAQHMALRVDFLPPEHCLELMRLFRRTAPLSREASRARLEVLCPPAWFDAFASIEPEPFAAASVGQVHRAVLHGGERVVVKLVKTDARARFLRDIDLLRRFLRVGMFLRPALRRVFDPLEALEAIRRNTLQELDLREEIAGQAVLREIYGQAARDFRIGSLSFHRIHPELSSHDVLVSEEIEGRPLDALIDEGAIAYPHLLELFRLHGYAMFCRGTFHGDIHPGNVLVTPEGKFVFVDTAAVGVAGERLRRGLLSFFEALSRYDYEACAVRLNEMASRRIEGRAFEAFRMAFLGLYAEYTGSTVAQVSLTRKMMQTIRLGVECGMVFESGMFPVIKSLMYLDGMVLRVNPQARLVEDMRPFVAEFEASMAGTA